MRMISLTSPAFRPKSRNWNAQNLFQGISPGSIFIPEEERSYFETFFWHDLCAESDSRNLYLELSKRKASFSEEFNSFADAWYQDEVNHTRGFSRIYHILFGESEESLSARVKQRPVDFSEFEEFLSDEFKLCVLFAYDEYATVLTYQKDSFYDRFGHPAFLEWIRNVRADEALHFINAVRLIHAKHAHRIPETLEVIHRIIEIEEGLTSYKSTFLFDHDSPHFLLSPEELSTTCVDLVYKKITGKLYPREERGTPFCVK